MIDEDTAARERCIPRKRLRKINEEAVKRN